MVSVEQLTYEEFIRSIPNPTVLNVFSLEPFEGKAILEINPSVIFYIIDRLFGGPGESSGIKGKAFNGNRTGYCEKNGYAHVGAF